MSLGAIIVELETVTAAGDPETLYWSDRAIRPFAPDDADRPNRDYGERLIEPPSLRRDLFADLDTLRADMSYGSLRVSNADGALNDLRTRAFGAVTIWRVQEGQPFSAGTLILRGLAATPEFTVAAAQARELRIPIFDRRAELDRDLQDQLYSGAGGLDGGDDLQDRPKPIGLGDLTVAHVPGVLVDPVTQVWQLHDGPMQAETGIAERGDLASGLTDAGDFTGSQFETEPIGAAEYVTDLSRGLFRHGGAPAGALGFDLQGDADGGFTHAAPALAARILARAGVDGGDIAASFAAGGVRAGAWFGDRVSAREALDYLSRAEAAAALPGRDGVYRWIPLAAPDETADAMLDVDDIADIAAESPAAPVGEVRIGYARNYQPLQASALAPAIVGTAREAFVREAWRYAVAADSGVKAKWPRSWRTIELLTPIVLKADAEALAAALLALFGPRADGSPKEVLRVTVEMTDARLALEPGATVALTYPPAGIDRNYLLAGEEICRPSSNFMIWRLFG